MFQTDITVTCEGFNENFKINTEIMFFVVVHKIYFNLYHIQSIKYVCIMCILSQSSNYVSFMMSQQCNWVTQMTTEGPES
jgi:phage shock protein PspC (stress-responsive transcriptional regulator)